MKRLLLCVVALLSLAGVAHAEIPAFSSSFKVQEIASNGDDPRRVGGSGPALLLLHGYGAARAPSRSTSATRKSIRARTRPGSWPPWPT